MQIIGITNTKLWTPITRFIPVIKFSTWWRASVFEGRACGAPVITSRASAPPQVVGEAGALVDPRDVTAIRREIELVLGSPQRQAAMRAKGIERARQFTWDKVAAKVRAVLEEAPRTVSAVARPSGLRKLHAAR